MELAVEELLKTDRDDWRQPRVSTSSVSGSQIRIVNEKGGVEFVGSPPEQHRILLIPYITGSDFFRPQEFYREFRYRRISGQQKELTLQ